MSEQLSCIRRDMDFVDFRILIEDDFLPCHRLILALHSPYMKTMLTSGMTEATKHELHLDHINMDVMKIILDYMYAGEFCVHQDKMMDIITASDYLQMTELKEMCIAEVPAILKPGNVVSWWEESSILGLDGIKTLCKEMMASDINKVSEQSEFLNLSYTELDQYICDICRDNVHDDVLAAVMRWVSYDQINRIEHMEHAICHVQLDRCSKQSIEQVIENHETLLDEHEVVKMILKTAVISVSPADIGKSQKPRSAMYIAGGHDCSRGDAVNQEIWIANGSRTMEKLCDNPYNHLDIGHSICETPNGFALTGGHGSSATLCIVYHALTKSWRRMSDMLLKREYHASVYVNGTLLVLGGCAVDPETEIKRPTHSVNVLLIENDTWERGPNLPFPTDSSQVTELDGKIYLLDQASHSLLHLDRESEVWSSKTSFPLNVFIAGVSMTSGHGRLYVAGGFSKVCAFYRPLADTWCFMQPPLYKHNYGALVHFNNKLVLLGGNAHSGTDKVEEYNFGGGSWVVCNYKMPAHLAGHCAVMLPSF